MRPQLEQLKGGLGGGDAGNTYIGRVCGHQDNGTCALLRSGSAEAVNETP